MVLGFNHNIVYKGEVFHVQTEDSGVKNPHIITLLYRGGEILSSKKTSYADIIMMENLESVVEELMKSQHKDMLRRLKSGEFDKRAFSLASNQLEKCEISAPGPVIKAAETVDSPLQLKQTDEIVTSSTSQVNSSKSDFSRMDEIPVQKSTPTSPNEQQSAKKNANDVLSLDDAILNFFGANGKK